MTKPTDLLGIICIYPVLQGQIVRGPPAPLWTRIKWKLHNAWEYIIVPAFLFAVMIVCFEFSFLMMARMILR